MSDKWFFQMKTVLQAFYLGSNKGGLPCVGFLRGTKAPAQWSAMAQDTKGGQAILLGNVKPTQQQWLDAGVSERTGDDKEIYLRDLKGFVILYYGHSSGRSARPWGVICPQTDDTMNLGFPKSLNYWRSALNK